MPESVNGEGGKASKGEYGFRYGASVPRPMLMAFSKVRARRTCAHECELLPRRVCLLLECYDLGPPGISASHPSPPSFTCEVNLCLAPRLACGVGGKCLWLVHGC